MKKMTEKALLEAFAGESMAHMKYLIFSEIAEKEGKPNIARLFKAIAYAEQVHATNHARNLGIVKKTPENLQTGIDGETYEVEEMYPVFNNTAKFQNEKGAEQSTHYALEAEKIHMKMYQDAKTSAEKDKDIDIKEIYICAVCGFTHIGKPPEYCPVCGAPNNKFKKF
uniref:Rubrerythrin family protein n=1 Tax=candidate division WOR-3 bacterium TaxID=2052148 RepID=A0A7V1EIH7_UNCW3